MDNFYMDNMQMMQQNQMYGANQGYVAGQMPYNSQYGQSGRITEAQMKDFIRMNVARKTGIPDINLIVMEDEPQAMRHACAFYKERPEDPDRGSVIQLPQEPLYIDELGCQLPVYFCRNCRKFYVNSERLKWW